LSASHWDLIRKHAVEVHQEDHLRKRIEAGERLRVKFGMDPTAPDIHVGHTVVLRKLRAFQDLGHTAVLIIGDFTARIGDPSGRSETRPPLTPQQVEANARTYLDQVGRVLLRERLEVRHQTEWFDGMKLAEVVGLMGKATVAGLLQREDFRKRMNEGRSIGLHEFLYPLLQGYDSVAVDADVELGGTDQLFNLLFAREVQRAYGREPEDVMVHPILEGTDGVQKMSKSLGNAIGLTDPPLEMYGKIMSISDRMMWRYYELLTDVSMVEIGRMTEEAAAGRVNPMEYKKGLARRIVADMHGEDAAAKAAEDWATQFQKRETPQEIEQVKVAYADVAAGDNAIKLDRLLARCGLAESVSDGLRKIKQNAVRIDGEVKSHPILRMNVPAEFTLRVGRALRRIILQ
jgi:tyrosyl-tRNA synthetase